MIRRHTDRTNDPAGAATSVGSLTDGFYREKLKEALGEGVAALNDPEIEKQVEAYFRDNPSFSRDAVHVAAVACRFKKEKVIARRSEQADSRQETISHHSCV